MIRISARMRACALVLTLAGFAAPVAASAETVADFYKGKTVNVLIGVGAGGEYDLQARLVARYLGKHIPGNPLVVPQNMTGAGGLKMANYLYEVAPRDGTYIGMIANSFPALQAVGLEGLQFDASKFGWLGTMAATVETMAVWHTAGIKSFEDLRSREIVAGASGKGAITFTLPAVMNEVLGTKFKIVTGYTGGNQINLAMERGEVQARNNTWSSWKATKPDWLRDNKLAIVVQAGPRASDLDAPSLEDLAKNAEDRQLVS
jgi:tripartite-type tricarboxylate transporter receptor subunit TctC